MSDLLLSSGFLAFARHAGVVQALRERAHAIDAIVGTSSGAVVGALIAAGHAPNLIMAELTRQPPRASLIVSIQPWRGMFRLDRMLEDLKKLLPPTFEALKTPLGVGVVDAQKKHRLITSGPLPEAVVASCAMPYVFVPVEVGGETFYDGGALDRLAVDAWRAWRPGKKAIAHHVAKTRGVDVTTDLTGVTVIKTPASGASLLSFGDWRKQMEEARAIAAEIRP